MQPGTEIPAKFISKWYVATLIGWIIGFVGVIIVAVSLESIGVGNFQFFIGICIGFGVGYMQGRLLNKVVKVDLKWMWASVIGMGLAFVITEFGSAIWTLIPEYNLNYAVALGGLLVGISQFRVIRKFSGRAAWWIVINFLSWTLSIQMHSLNDYTGNWDKSLQWLGIVIFILGPPLVLGLVSALGMNWILKAKTENPS